MMKTLNSDHDKKSPSQASRGNVQSKNVKCIAKNFKFRNSLIRDLDEKGHIRTFYLINPILFTVLLMALIRCLVLDERSSEYLSFIMSITKKLDIGMAILFVMEVSVMLIFFPALSMWTHFRQKSLETEIVGHQDRWILISYVIYMVGFIIFPAYSILHYDLGLMMTLVMSLEQLRLLMKMYSYAREAFQKIVHSKAVDKSGESAKFWKPQFKNFLYFLFAPTLIYRDSYPRTAFISWKKFFLHLLGFLICTPLYMITCATILKTNFDLYGQIRFFSVENLTLSFFICAATIATPNIMVGYGFWHCYSNACAELLRFGDRLFYKDWWYSTSFGSFFSSWAFPIYEWLDCYIYIDIQYALSVNENVAKLLVALISAIGHDYIMSLGVGYFLAPNVLVIIICIPFLPFVKQGKTEGSSPWMFWLKICFTNLIAGHFVLAELHCRVNCNRDSENEWLNFFYPCIISC